MKRDDILKKRENLEKELVKRGQRDGVEIEKGAVLTEDFLIKNEELFRKYLEYFSAYPDLLLDMIKPSESTFSLFFYQRIVLRALMRYKEVYVVACVKGDSPVLTEMGMVPIKDVNPNDKVWSDGEWRQPENLNRKEWHGDLVKLFAEGCFEDEITVTDNHKFWAIKRDEDYTRPGKFWKDGLNFFNIQNFTERKEFYRKSLREVEPEWIEAKDLTPNDWLLSSIDLEVNDTKLINVPSAPPRTKNIIPNQIKLDENFYEWLGIWLAEGSWQNSAISFTIHKNEDRLKERIIDLTKKVFGLDVAIYLRESQAQVLRINSAHLNVFFEELFGCCSKDINQWNKWIPTVLLKGDPKKQLQLVKGWLDGDGYYRIVGNSHRYKGTTVSNVMVEGMKHILYRNFINPSITLEAREGKAKVYNLNFNGLLAKEFRDAMDENRLVEIDETMRLGLHYPVKFGEKYYMTNKVRYAEILPPDDEDVYCLQMENGMFNLNGVESHNCRAFSKSFITILGMFLQCVLIPGTKRFICAPNKNQAAQIAKEKIFEIYTHFPLLRKEVLGGEISDTPGNFGKDYVTIKFRNSSQFDVVGALDSQRGGRRHGGLIDEIRDHDEVDVNEIVLPLMNVSRRLPDNTVNLKEPNQQVVCIDSYFLNFSRKL